jgi:hypothetical protein
MCNIQTAVSPRPLKIVHVYMKLLTRNSPYCHLLKYLLFLLKHPVYQHMHLTATKTRRYKLMYGFQFMLCTAVGITNGGGRNE